MHLSEDLLRRYFQNQCTAEEAQFVREALESEDPLTARLLEKYWEEADSGEDLPAAERSAMFSDIQSRIVSRPELVVQSTVYRSQSTVERPKSSVLRQLPVYALRIAASVTLLLGVAIGLYTLGSREPELQYHTVSSDRDQRQVMMPDSTMVWLASHSRLTYSSAYNKADRQVRLVGEAYFEVKHDTGRPFIVTTSTLATRVLGTHFNIKADSIDHQIEVTLLEGKVSVSRVDSITQTTENLALLTPNQQLVYDCETGKPHQRDVIAYDYAAWKDGVLSLKNVTFEEALQRVEKWYDVKISVDDPSIKRCMIHASFQRATLENVLKSMGISLGYSYEIRSREVTIHGGGCKH